MRSAHLLVALALLGTVPTPALAEPGGLVSDDFSGGLDAGVWSVVDPLGDGVVGVSGQGGEDAVVSLSVPAGVSHDAWGDNRSLRVVQGVGDVDFEVEVRFDSLPTEKYQTQGLLVEQDGDDWLRFDVHSAGAGQRVFAASTVAGVSSSELLASVQVDGSVWLRVSRVGDVWSLGWSGDGQAFSEVGSFEHALAVSAVGPFAANHSPSPAFTAVVDYVFDTAAPIDPEDGVGQPAGDEVAPVIQGVAVAVGHSAATVSWSTDEPASSAVSFGPTVAYEGGTVAAGELVTAHEVVLEGLSPGSTYHFQVASTDQAGNTAVTDDATFTTTTEPVEGAPVIDVWYGDEQEFGHRGRTQPWANILGNVTDPDGVASLTYTLNGGTPQPLSIGPDSRRLQFGGDFNVELAMADLQLGANTVEIAAVDGAGTTALRTVTVHRRQVEAPALPHIVDWSSSSAVTDLAQPVDGRWSATGDTLVTDHMGYDRVVAIGDTSWTDYDVTVPVTVHGLGPDSGTPQSGAPLVGLGLRWDGHTNLSGEQPSRGFYPIGAYAWYRWYDNNKVIELTGSGGTPVQRSKLTLEFDVTYMMRASVETLADGTRYRYKMWRAGDPEPDWQLEITTTEGNRSGSVALIAHHANVSFGAVQVAAPS